MQVAPLSIMHLLGFLTTNMSLGAVNVSLTHTIKSLEPFFTVVLSYFFLGAVPSLPIVLTLVPIVAGVVVASATDLSFNWWVPRNLGLMWCAKAISTRCTGRFWALTLWRLPYCCDGMMQVRVHNGDGIQPRVSEPQRPLQKIHGGEQPGLSGGR